MSLSGGSVRRVRREVRLAMVDECGVPDTDYLMPAHEVMASIMHMAQNMEEKLPPFDHPTINPPTATPQISAYVAAGRNSSARRYNGRGGRGGRGPLPNKCSGCGGLNHIMSSCNASDDALMKWTLAKRKMIVRKYGTPSRHASHNALLSDLHQ
jgi:hypothetical protein